MHTNYLDCHILDPLELVYSYNIVWWVYFATDIQIPLKIYVNQYKKIIYKIVSIKESLNVDFLCSFSFLIISSNIL